MFGKPIATATVAAMLALGSAACGDDDTPLSPTAPSDAPASAARDAATTTTTQAGAQPADATPATPATGTSLIEPPQRPRPPSVAAHAGSVSDLFTITTYNEGTAEWKIRVIQVAYEQMQGHPTYRVQVRSTRSYEWPNGTAGQHRQTYPIEGDRTQKFRGNIVPAAQYCVYAEEIDAAGTWPYSLGCVTTPACRDGREYDARNPGKCRPKPPPQSTGTPGTAPTCPDTRYRLATIRAHHDPATLSLTYSDSSGCVHLYRPSSLSLGTNRSPTNMTQAPQCSAGFYVRNTGSNAVCRRWGRN